MKTKFIFVTGGIVSSLGKGIASAVIGTLLKSCGFKISILKVDPYINVDPGTMSPFQHGEVFITEDGSETDLDLGHYERFTGLKMSAQNNFTAGKVYDTVMKKERKGDFLGSTIQVVPHITDEIKKRIFLAAKEKDILIVEVGGTVGDIESLPFLEAIRQLHFELDQNQIVNIHMTLVPWIKSAQELKTKPTQYSVNKLREIGIQADILICRSANSLSQEIKKKIALFTNVKCENVISGVDVDCVYEIPFFFEKEKIHNAILKKLGIGVKKPNLKEWQTVVNKYKKRKIEVCIGLAGKYLKVRDAYKSLFEALEHAAIHQKIKLNIIDCKPEKYEKDDQVKLECDGLIVPGAFGKRGSEGKISCIKYARENKIPFFGICFGFQMAIVEYARNVLGLKDVYSAEIKPKAENRIIEMMEEQKKKLALGGTMRLGLYKTDFVPKSLISSIYGKKCVEERHRHRFEMNNEYIDKIASKNFVCSGFYKSKLVETIEIKDHPWFIAVQYHPEFNSNPIKPHPLFSSFIKASYQNKIKNRKS